MNTSWRSSYHHSKFCLAGTSSWNSQAGTNIEDADKAKSGVFYHVSVSIWMAKDLIEADPLGGSDPYVIAECQGVKLRTETVKSNV